MDATLWILLGFGALLYFVCIWESGLSAWRARGYNIPRWVDALGIAGFVVGEVAITGQILADGVSELSPWLWITISGLLIVIAAGIGLGKIMTQQATQIVRGTPSAIRAPEISEAEKERLDRLKRRSSTMSIVGALFFLLCWGIGFGTLDLMAEGIPALNAGLIAGGPVLGVIALVWTALLHRHIRRIEGNNTQETGPWWNW